MRKALYSVLLIVFLASVVIAQESKKDESSSRPNASSSNAKTAYRLDYKVFEMDDGKRVNQREFTSLASTFERGGPSSNLRIGTRVPVGTATEKPNYIDVGLSINTSLADQGGKLAASIRIEVSSFAIPEQNADPRSSSMPVLRNTNFNVETVLTPGKPQIIASIDDVNSKKRMQVEVTATRID